LKLIAFGAPVALALVLLSIYSYARFGSFSEVGTSYQLQTIPELYESFNVQHRPPR
jgi:hypothetical protein